jgi:hypothetical protein
MGRAIQANLEKSIRIEYNICITIIFKFPRLLKTIAVIERVPHSPRWKAQAIQPGLFLKSLDAYFGNSNLPTNFSQYWRMPWTVGLPVRASFA